MKRINLVYFSPTEATKKTVREVAKGIDLERVEYDLLLSKSRKDFLHFEKEDLLIIGAPVYGGQIPRLMHEFIRDKISGKAKAVIIAVYGNRAYDNALAEMKDLLSKKGISVIAAGAFLGEHSYSEKIASNRPDELDQTKQYAFGLMINEKINKNNYCEVDVPGEVPKEINKISSYFTNTNSNCILCGICARECPVSAISLVNPSEDSNENCIMCCRCIRNCPYDAREYKSEKLSGFVKGLEERVAHIRKEPEVFI
jgi:ferredoxin